MVEQFTGREGVNELFAFDLDALSTSTDLDGSRAPPGRTTGIAR